MESFSKTQEQVKKITDLTNEKSMLVEMKREPLEENLFSYLSQFTIGIFTVFILLKEIFHAFKIGRYAMTRIDLICDIAGHFLMAIVFFD